jgi:FtsP/CotA-like multicopper oxidase with cupredoxin domain
MRRARFLGTSVAGMAALALAPRSARAAASDTVEYTLTASRLTLAPAPGVRAAALAFNDRVPGPVLRARYGQRVRVRYLNRTGEPTSVHWHGMILPNAMDGAAGLTQPPVPDGGSFLYEFAANPPGTRWYHDHAGNSATVRGLFGMFVVEDPRDEPADAEFALVLHDVPAAHSLDAAMAGTSGAPMTDPPGSPELREMRAGDKMGDEIAYTAHCINGAAYPATTPLEVKVGQRVRLRILNANQTQTRYVRLAGHRLRVTHADGNPLMRPLEVDALRVGVGERYDAWFEVRSPGAWLLQGLSSDPLAFEQAVVVHTPGLAHAAPDAPPPSLANVDYFTYEKAGGLAGNPFADGAAQVRRHFTLDGGQYASSRWTLNGKVWPDTEKIHLHRNDTAIVRFTNKADMDHPMHLHGHTFDIVEIDGRALLRPLAKDISLVRAGGGTLTWRFRADSPPGRWLLHCHNEIHMMDGMMTEVVYT